MNQRRVEGFVSATGESQVRNSINCGGCIWLGLISVLLVQSCKEGDSASDSSETIMAICEQHLPPISTNPVAVGNCEVPIPESNCIFTGCNECQVCFFDAICPMPSDEDSSIGCSCRGDGNCYELCENNGDCDEGSHCIVGSWFNLYDTEVAEVNLCWPDGNPPFGEM